MVVDTNRPEQVASREVLQSCNKVAVIDHHRRAATYIEGGALYFHEPYASSTCELVSELLGYLMEPGELLRGEAEAMMAGLMLDTKNFTMRTGGRTFEAAAFLRRAGGDTGEVKKMFQTGLADTVAKYGIIQNAKMYRQDIAIAPVDHTVNRVTAAQAADELLNIAGINTSFVLYPDGDRVVVSARSINDTNVQVILEALGGGGNAGAAGAQIAGQTLKQVTESLMATLERYFKTDDPEEMGEEEEYFLPKQTIFLGGTHHESDFTAGREGPRQEGPDGGRVRRVRPQLPSAPQAGGGGQRREHQHHEDAGQGPPRP